MPRVVTRRNATFQQWQALATNRAKRHQQQSFLVQGVRPIDTAVACGWPLRAILHGPPPRSRWADELLDGPVPADRVEVAPDLLAELGGREEGPPEVVVVAAIPADDLTRLGAGASLLVVADRVASPGNLGSLIRSADALGADAVVVVGHAADPFDPRAVRSSRGSLFAVPTVRCGSPAGLLDWLRGQADRWTVVGASEDGRVPPWDHDWRPPTALVVGNEAGGLSRAWSEASDATVRIPMVGRASSLNVAVAASLLLYEATRQRRRDPAVDPRAQ